MKGAVGFQILWLEGKKVHVLGRGCRLSHASVKVVVQADRSAGSLGQSDQLIVAHPGLQVLEGHYIRRRRAARLAGIESGAGPDAASVDGIDEHLRPDG